VQGDPSPHHQAHSLGRGLQVRCSTSCLADRWAMAASVISAQRRVRNTAAWRLAKALARQRDPARRAATAPLAQYVEEGSPR
jgi:hypothetical protein